MANLGKTPEYFNKYEISDRFRKDDMRITVIGKYFYG
jgi:hypothetical protein